MQKGRKLTRDSMYLTGRAKQPEERKLPERERRYVNDGD
jgi:hypothetical protein